MVAFGFLPQNFWRWQGPTNGTLSFYECRFSGGDTMRWWGQSNPKICKRIGLNLLHSQAVKPKSHNCGTFTTFNCWLELYPLAEKVTHLAQFFNQMKFNCRNATLNK